MRPELGLVKAMGNGCYPNIPFIVYMSNLDNGLITAGYSTTEL